MSSSVETQAKLVRSQLAAIPSDPGVYVYRDGDDRVLYVGKAKSLRKRVHSYFTAPLAKDETGEPSDRRLRARTGTDPKITDLVRRIARVETFVTTSDSEATILEANLVKRHRPPFNVRLRDDKSYPYIAVSLDEDYPRVYFTRERHRSSRVYFGPFSSAYKVRDTLSLINKIFPSRPCEGPEPGRASGVPCLDYHIKRCLAPCVDYISKEDYRALINQIIAFLSGRYRGLEDDLEEQMRTAAAAQDFERAAVLRNRLTAVRHLTERQLASSGSVGTLDVIGVAAEGELANVQVLQVRDGVLGDRQSFFLDTAGPTEERTIVEEFAREYYSLAMAIPPLVVVPAGLDGNYIEAMLSDRRGAAVEVRAAERGDKRRLAQMAERNAVHALGQERLRHEHSRAARREGLTQLAAELGLEAPPARIECFDVSNIGDSHPVASMVVLEGGQPASSHYRSFSLKHERADDFARMREAVTRRFTRLADDSEADPSFSSRPSLVVIDGGKGQLGAALAGIADAGIEGLVVVGLAKRLEEVYLQERSEPLLLPEDSPALRALQRARDEAHRFALRHHRRRRDQGMTDSVLDGLPGVGPARRRAILRHFGSVDGFLAASRHEVEAVPGLPPKVARDIWDRLNKTAGPVS